MLKTGLKEGSVLIKKCALSRASLAGQILKILQSAWQREPRYLPVRAQHAPGIQPVKFQPDLLRQNVRSFGMDQLPAQPPQSLIGEAFNNLKALLPWLLVERFCQCAVL